MEINGVNPQQFVFALNGETAGVLYDPTTPDTQVTEIHTAQQSNPEHTVNASITDLDFTLTIIALLAATTLAVRATTPKRQN